MRVYWYRARIMPAWPSEIHISCHENGNALLQFAYLYSLLVGFILASRCVQKCPSCFGRIVLANRLNLCKSLKYQLVNYIRGYFIIQLLHIYECIIPALDLNRATIIIIYTSSQNIWFSVATLETEPMI